MSISSIHSNLIALNPSISIGSLELRLSTICAIALAAIGLIVLAFRRMQQRGQNAVQPKPMPQTSSAPPASIPISQPSATQPPQPRSSEPAVPPAGPTASVDSNAPKVASAAESTKDQKKLEASSNQGTNANAASSAAEVVSSKTDSKPNVKTPETVSSQGTGATTATSAEKAVSVDPPFQKVFATAMQNPSKENVRECLRLSIQMAATCGITQVLTLQVLDAEMIKLENNLKKEEKTKSYFMTELSILYRKDSSTKNNLEELLKSRTAYQRDPNGWSIFERPKEFAWDTSEDFRIKKQDVTLRGFLIRYQNLYKNENQKALREEIIKQLGLDEKIIEQYKASLLAIQVGDENFNPFTFAFEEKQKSDILFVFRYFLSGQPPVGAAGTAAAPEAADDHKA